jgi:TRAP-type C4-dicarboxylate transport system permease large subunit
MLAVSFVVLTLIGVPLYVSVGLTTALALFLLDILSNLLIIYGLVAETSIPRLFLAGVLPRILVTPLLMITTYVIARRRGYGGGSDPFSWSPFLRAAWDGKVSIGAPVLILGGIYDGGLHPQRPQWYGFLFIVCRCFYLPGINHHQNTGSVAL